MEKKVYFYDQFELVLDYERKFFEKNNVQKSSFSHIILFRLVYFFLFFLFSKLISKFIEGL